MSILGTTALRAAWAPACSGPFTPVKLYGDGTIHVRPATADAFRALNACLEAHNYRTRRNDTGAFNCRKITGGTGYSLHAYGIAADINWSTNPYGPRLVTDMPRAMVDAILAIRTNDGRQVFGWGGNYRTNKDAMHFEVVCTPASLATGLDPATLVGRKPVPLPPNVVRTWRPFGAGATDNRIAAAGGMTHEVAEVQMILTALAGRWGNPAMHPGKVDGLYGTGTQNAVRAFKRQIIAIQRLTRQPVWPNDDANVGAKTIATLRYWNTHS